MFFSLQRLPNRTAQIVFLLVILFWAPVAPVPGAESRDDFETLEAMIYAGEYEEALEMANRMVAKATEEFGPDSLETAAALNWQVAALWKNGKIDAEVQALAERALRIRRDALGENHPDTATSMNSLGNIQLKRGNFAGALETYTAALKIQQAVQSEDTKAVAIAYNNLAMVQVRLGNDLDARRNYEKALEILEKIFGPRHKMLSTTISSLGSLYLQEGNVEKALHYYRRALEILEENYGPNHPQAGPSLANIAFLYASLERYEEALIYNKRAQVVAEATIGRDNPRAIFYRQNEAVYTWKLGDRVTASAMFKKILAEFEQAVEPDHHYLITARLSVGMGLEEEGKLDEAEAMYRLALDQSRRIYGDAAKWTYESLGFLSDLHTSEGKYFTAIEEAVEAESLQRRAFLGIAASLTEADALRRDRIHSDQLGYAAISLLTLNEQLASGKLDRGKAGAVAEATGTYWDQLIRSRAAVLDEIGARGRVLQSATDRETQNLVVALEEAQDRLAVLLLQGEGGSDLEALAESLEAKGNAEKALAAKSLEMRRRLAARSAGVGDVRAALPPGTALVAFSAYAELVFSPMADNSPHEYVKRYFALVLESGSKAPWAIRIGEATELESRIGRWQKEAGTPPPVLPLLARKAEERYREAGRALREMLWDPIAARLGEVDRVLIVPMDQINLVSFATLPDDRDGYLAESGISLHYLSAERDLAASRDGGNGSGLLALGGIRYQKEETGAGRPTGQDCKTLADLQFTPLPGSRLEATEIASLWAGSHGENPAPVVLTGLAATEAEFKKSAPGKEALHLATHGFFAASSCNEKGDRISELTGTDSDLAILVDADLEANPLLLTGLALSGANDRGSGSGNDGLLSAAEIAGLPLNGIRWAVLSACETGLGRIQDAEGVLGMRRAFQIAGVSTLIMSLWPVDDQATREWMTSLYQARLAGASSSDAVRQAHIAVLQSLRKKRRSTHPYTWGAFVAAGDYR